MKILIAEDDKVSEILMKNYMKVYGECHMVDNGKKALDAFIEAFHTDPFDLICLDIMMPVMTGQEALREIRLFEQKNGRTGLDQTKIIMVTALDQKDEIMEAFNSGCESYIIKPVSKSDIEKAVKDMGL